MDRTLVSVAHGPVPSSLLLVGVLCVVGCGLAFAAAGRAASVGRPFMLTLWTGLAAALLGAVVWGCGLASLLGVGAEAALGYDIRMIGAALLVALVMTGAGIGFAVGPLKEGGVAAAAFGGAVIGAAAPATHYVGLAAVRLAAPPAFNDVLLWSAVAGATLVGGAAFALAARLPTVAGRAGAAALLAVAMAGFHLAAVSATAVAPDAGLASARVAAQASQIAFYAAALAGALLVAVAAAAALDWRYGEGGAHESSRLRAFADLTSEGIVVCEDQRIVDVNVAASRLVGLDPNAIRGRALRDFFDMADPDRTLSASLAKPQEASLKSNGGEPLWVEIVSRDLLFQGRPRRVFTLRDLSEQRRNEHQIRHLAYHDPLTGLANRAAFNEALQNALRRGGEVALFCIDLDKFKEINDVFGHAAGDEVLRTAGRRIVAGAPDAMVFRLGGDEFVAIGTGPDAGDADKLALRIAERLNVDLVVAGNTIRCGASVGFAVYPHHGSNVDTLFANADAALYRAKADGRGLSRGFEAGMDLALREQRALQQDLATALSRNEMFLHWMPQANTRTGEIVGFEALLRWKHPVRGVVPPVTFIPVAEETAAIVPIGEWVLRTACSEAVKWVRAGKVAVNLSPIQFQHGDIVALVHSILYETGLPAARLELEITEGVLLHDLPGALQTLRRLKALGVQIAMDDFGTGYSSLSYLQAFPFDRIKIDASFIRTLSTSPQAKAIVRAVVALGESLQMPITAEGVETAEQRAFLDELHCEEIQGYLVGRPSPVISFDSPFARSSRARAVG